MRDVDDVGEVGGGIAAENYSLYCRYEVIRGAKVGKQGDERDTGTRGRGDTKKRGAFSLGRPFSNT